MPTVNGAGDTIGAVTMGLLQFYLQIPFLPCSTAILPEPYCCLAAQAARSGVPLWCLYRVGWATRPSPTPTPLAPPTSFPHACKNSSQDSRGQTLLAHNPWYIPSKPYHLKPGMSCPSWQWHKAGYRWSPARVRNLLVALLWCDLGRS